MQHKIEPRSAPIYRNFSSRGTENLQESDSRKVKKQQQHQQHTSIHHYHTLFELAVEAKITTIKQSF
jgi:hypothetical protein